MAVGRLLPVEGSPLVGRAEQVAGLRELMSGRSRLVTLTGPPGVGKTRLALHVATALAPGFGGGAGWVDLGSIRDPRQVAGELARGLGAERDVDLLGPELPLTAFADREVLLVVDNCEHLADAGLAIAAVLEAMPGARVLATSRQRLRLTAEVEYPLPPLALPALSDADDIAELGRNPSVELLLARSPAHVTLTRRTARPLAEMCLRLDGLPLALELAAARLRVFTPSELVFRLEHRSVTLSGAPRDAPSRHRTLVAAIGWSHDLLPDLERTVFRRLSVLVGGWTLAAARAVCGLPEPTVVAAVEVLLEQSLLQREATDGPARFTMLASIRDFAAEQLATSGELGATRERHADYFAGVAVAWEATIGTETENTTWVEFEAVHPDLSAAFEHAGQVPARVWLGVALAWYCHIHGALTQAPTVLAVLREVAADSASAAGCDGEPAPDGSDADVVTAMAIAAGVISLGLGESAEAESDLRSAVRLSAARGDDRRQAIALSFLGHVMRERGRTEQAAGLYRLARGICLRRGNVRGTAWSTFDLGLLMLDAHDPSERSSALPLLREALVYFEDLDYEWAVAQSARALATALLDRGAVDDAAALLGRSLVLHDRVGDRRGAAECLEGLARVAADRGSGSESAWLCGAAQAQRQLAATTPTESEARRIAATEAAVDSALGTVAADHARHTGRTAGRPAVLAFAAGIAAPQPPTVSDLVLTARQAEVAELVAAGRTNRQIGRALGISEKTAEIHVSNIMARLKVPSRAGVAAWIGSRPRRDP